MLAISPHEVTVNMIVTLSTPDGVKSHPMVVAKVSEVDVHGWQRAIEILFVCCMSERRHLMFVGVDDFSRSGNQLHLIARP